MNFLNGFKTYLAAAGMLGLALFQFSTGDYATAWQSMMGALAAFGLRVAIANAVNNSNPPAPPTV